MTALGAIIALMPLALGIGAGAQLHQPLGNCRYWWLHCCHAITTYCFAKHNKLTL
ncbi:hypothetical protein [Pedobacter steynii]